MGQECGKPAWPKPAGGYQTITGRRYGRRHAYIGFRPTLPKHKRASKDNAMEWQGMELNSVQEEANSLSSAGSITSTLQAMFPVAPNSVHPEVQSSKFIRDVPSRKHTSSHKGPDAAAAFSYKKVKYDQVVSCNSETNLGPKKSLEACAWPKLEDRDDQTKRPGGLSFVNIDSYEPDSSEGEEDEVCNDRALETHPGLQKRLDNMICELEKEFDYISGLHSFLYTKTCEEDSDPASDSARSERDIEEAPRDRSAPAAEKRAGPTRSCDHAGPPCSCDHRLDEPEDYTAGASPAGDRTPRKSFDCKSDQGGSQSEMVVRPKIRKQTSESHLERRKCPPQEDLDPGFGRAAQAAGKWSSVPPFFLTQTEKPTKDFLFEFTHTYSGAERRAAEGSVEDLELSGRAKQDEDEDLWEDLEDFNEKCVSFAKDGDSSECSEGEWSATWTSDSAVEKERCSSAESWETLPGLDEPEHELQSNGSSLDDVPDLSFNSEGQMPLEEGEIPWLPYQEETDSSSDEDADGISHFVHPGLFMLDGNNNFEDDSSMSEDFDAEWRLLDEFGEGFGVAQAISYVDPQLLTYMALEERLAQAMEAALAHLESLAIDVEQAHPPATEDIINCLPQITVLEDHHGQEQCCAICCCEYVKDEIATELPCRHVFHKTCVTLWLQKSGTCPVCRHVLSPALPDAAVATSFVSDHDSPPSTHSAAGTR
ncbi:E3 ubiquitin-protein ligase Praja-2 isoform X2 [Amia ocellicauda]|uniref:E3 ubiquitin-protein ligase Praja-2 isoform X2 n=1 Tax=Amia ocellicauda TaxID=2972642 RepID=UPI0034646BA8